MSDETLRALRREAEASRDGATWLRLAQVLAREGRFDEAGLAVLSAEECGSDGGAVLESFAPSHFTLRALDAGPPRPGANPQLAWSPDGRELFVAEDAPDGTAGIIAWDVARGRARSVALNLRAPSVSGLVVDSAGRLLLGYRDPRAEGRPTVSFVERGFLQPPLVADHAVFDAALALGHVFTNDAHVVRAFVPRAKKTAWEVEGRQVVLDPTGTVAIFDGARVALHDPFTRARRWTQPVDDAESYVTIARRRALVRTRTKALLCDGVQVTERALPEGRRPDHVALAPSARHYAALAHGPGTVTIHDTRTGELQAFERGAMIGLTAAWSPSGRTLAVAKTTGELSLLEGR